MQNVVVNVPIFKDFKKSRCSTDVQHTVLSPQLSPSNQKTKEKKNNMCGIRLPATTDALLGFLYVCGTR